MNAIRTDPITGIIDEASNPFAFAASKGDPDTLRYHEAMVADDAEYFHEAMEVEISTLSEIDCWDVVERSTVPKHRKVIPGTWAFKRKRYPDGSIRKYKARYCVRGDLQVEGIDYFETWAPVVSWATVRLLFVMATVFKLSTRQVDYTNAFAQAKLDHAVYIEIPKGYRADREGDYVLKLKRTLYGMSQSPKAFFEYLKEGLENQDFVPSPLDPCLFIHKKMIALCYVDDLLLFARSLPVIDAMLDDLEQDYALTRESEVSAFLGIQINSKNEGEIELTQTGLIKRILEATKMEDCNAIDTPATAQPLGTDADGKPFAESWDYRSVVGMLLYLTTNSRSELAYAVNQCARFTHSPKQSHAKAVKRICRYLQGTKDKGMILRPTNELTVDCYVDADFAGLWQVEDDQDPVCVRSRTGYVLMLAGCPLLWCSKLQSEVTLSTLEAEFVALSQAMREIIPMRELVQEVSLALCGDPHIECRTFSKVYEDNNGALTLATIPRMTPRTKHIACKYFFFREKVQKLEIKVIKIESEENIADIYTKGLLIDKFAYLRKKLLGW
jgi:histone deacetylase 1/2